MVNELFSVLDALQRYSNLILVIVTTIYVTFTWWMVREMRLAREAEIEPQIVADLIPLGGWLVKLRIYNAGNGPANDIDAIIRLQPDKNIPKQTWVHPVLLSGAYHEFWILGDTRSLQDMAAEHEKLIIEISWKNSFKRLKAKVIEFDLKSIVEAWSGTRMLLPTPDISAQLEKMTDELKRIKDLMQKQENRNLMKEYELSLKNEEQDD
jgi:hypothetical protein